MKLLMRRRGRDTVEGRILPEVQHCPVPPAEYPSTSSLILIHHAGMFCMNHAGRPEQSLLEAPAVLTLHPGWAR